MKALIFSVSAGGGHRHAAEAIKSYVLLNEPDSDIRIIDTLKYINPFLDKIIIGSYLRSLKITPSLFGKLYDYAETDDGLAAISNKVSEMITYKLLPLVNEFEPDIVISTHAFSTMMLSILKIKYGMSLPTVSLLTDYAAHSFWIHPGIDAYIVSNADMIDEMTARRVPAENIYDLGIPVKPDFLTRFDRGETLRELGLSKDKFTLLVMGGSLGIGRIPHIYEELMKVNKDFQIIFITGSNKKLYGDLQKLQESSSKATRIIGYTHEVNRLMQASDLLLTKPGGITITEALTCETPLAIFSPIPGQEEKNAEFLLKHNLAVHVGAGKNCGLKIEELLSNPTLLHTIRGNCSKFSRLNSGNDIYQLLYELIRKNVAIDIKKSSKP